MRRTGPADAAFSPSDAALEGFQVLRRNWRMVAGWSLFNLIALVALVVVSAIATFGAAAASSAGAMHFSGSLGALLASLGEALTVAVLTAGQFRLMLRPEEPGLLHLRLGADELRLLAVWAVLLIVGFLMVGLSVLLAAAGGALGPAGALIAWIAVAATGVWLGLRLSLVTVTTFAERRFDFAGAWRLTRGHVWSLLGMALLSACIVALIALLFTLALMVLLGVTVGFGSMMDAFFDPQALTSHPGVYLVELVAELALTPVVAVLLLAPWVSAYQSFSRAPAAA